MWKLLKNIFAINESDTAPRDESPSIQKMVSYNSLNKRKNARIKYPHFGGCGPFPRVFYSGTEMIVANISVGGLLVIDDTEAFGTEVGDVVMMEFIWPDLTTKVRSRVVGANLQRRHLQFVDFNAAAFLKISRLVKPGHLGQRFHRVKDDSGSLQALELWVGPTGESLTFYSDDRLAELTINGEQLTFKKGSTKIYSNRYDQTPISLIEESLIVISNLPDSSPNIKLLLEIIELNLRSGTQKKSGTHG